jgi:hypothetical protein
MPTTQTTAAPSFESVWAALDRIDRLQEETAHQIKETARQMKETDQKILEYNECFGFFTKRFGEVVEHMIVLNLCDKFKEFDFIFSKVNSGTRVKDRENKIHFEIDYLLENSLIAMLVEVKTRLSTDDIKEHIERLEKMRMYADLHDDKRSFLGAVAGVIMKDNVKDYALKQGLFVIEPSGESFFLLHQTVNLKNGNFTVYCLLIKSD